ncbi:MAG: hypothetical protein QM756_12060 [Polyangiaceae bacterium]
MSQSGPTLRTYLWDFFGARAEPTAVHFQKHLDEFLLRNALTGCETGVRSEQPGHFAAFCRAPLDQEETLVRALRPQRVL